MRKQWILCAACLMGISAMAQGIVCLTRGDRFDCLQLPIKTKC